jgi:N12 class adenine-specific DNA methylase
LKVGYGKTAISLALIDSAPAPSSFPALKVPLVPAKATLIVVPSHLSGQWPDEVTKFLGGSKKVCVLRDLATFNSTTVKKIKDADIVVATFSLLSNEKYMARLARLSGVEPTLMASKGRCFEAKYSDCARQLPSRVEQILRSCSEAYTSIHEQASETPAIVTMNNRKAAYGKKSTSNCKTKGRQEKPSREMEPFERDPWGLKSLKNYENMKCPPLEMFHWHRVIVDE